MATLDDMTTALAKQSMFKARGRTTTRYGALVALAAVLALSPGATSQAGAAALACKPTVTVTNFLNVRIRVLNFKYRLGDNTIYTEGLANKILVHNDFEDWPSQTLNHAPNGTRITSSAVEFQKETSTGWAAPEPLIWFPHTFYCGENHSYNHEIRP